MALPGGAYLSWTLEGSSQLQVLLFDAVISESHEATVEVTQHKVESGGDVTDNVRNDVDKISLQVYVSSCPILTDDERIAAALGANATMYQLANPYNGAKTTQTLKVPNYVAPLALTPGALFNAVESAATQIVTGVRPSPVRFVNANVLTFQNTFFGPQDVLKVLKNLITTTTMLTCVTTTQTYDNLVISHVELERDPSTGGGANLEIEFTQLEIVSTQTVAAVKTIKPAPAKPRGTPLESKSIQNPKTQSIFSQALNGSRNPFSFPFTNTTTGAPISAPAAATAE